LHRWRGKEGISRALRGQRETGQVGEKLGIKLIKAAKSGAEALVF
jgi:hypothetical protein